MFAFRAHSVQENWRELRREATAATALVFGSWFLICFVFVFNVTIFYTFGHSLFMCFQGSLFGQVTR